MVLVVTPAVVSASISPKWGTVCKWVIFGALVVISICELYGYMVHDSKVKYKRSVYHDIVKHMGKIIETISSNISDLEAKIKKNTQKLIQLESQKDMQAYPDTGYPMEVSKEIEQLRAEINTDQAILERDRGNLGYIKECYNNLALDTAPSLDTLLKMEQSCPGSFQEMPSSSTSAIFDIAIESENNSDEEGAPYSGLIETIEARMGAKIENVDRAALNRAGNDVQRFEMLATTFANNNINLLSFRSGISTFQEKAEHSVKFIADALPAEWGTIINDDFKYSKNILESLMKEQINNYVNDLKNQNGYRDQP